MTLKLDNYTVRKLFMKRIPPTMRNAILEDHLRVELNTLDELVLSGKAWEDTEHSKKEYAVRDATPAHKSGEKASRLRDQPRPFSGTKVFLCPKGNQQHRGNNREADHLRTQFVSNAEGGNRDITANAPNPSPPLRTGIQKHMGN